jgi:molybdate/tungstate transport system substrate-binding protein
MERRGFLVSLPLGLLLAHTGPARAEATLRVAYAGSMGVVMDRVLGSAFAEANHVSYQGTGQGSYALARLLAAKQMQADVFVSVTPGPVRVLQQAGLAHEAVPVASTRMVIAYAPRSRFAGPLAEAAQGHGKWWEILQTQGFRFGRTDPLTDPQGQNILFTMDLAERYYHAPGLARAVLGPVLNPAQIFAEPSLLSRLEAGQIDASSGYHSAVASHGLPFVGLPDEINLGDPAFEADWYSRVSVTLPQPHGGQKVVRPQPLVFYAAVLTNAPEPELGRRFVDFLSGAQGQAMLRRSFYDPPKGGALQAA